jgi:L-lactate dehydrogenase complex protein LldG
MPVNSSRESILHLISVAREKRQVLDNLTPENNVDIYKSIFPDPVTCFKNELELINGKCFICENETDLYMKLRSYVLQSKFPYVFCLDSYISNQLKVHNIPYSKNETDFNIMQAGITGCEFLIARTGSVVVSSFSESGRQMNVFPPVHIVLAHVSQLVNYPEEAFDEMHNKYADGLPSSISTITGPSRTADIEKTLVLGAHGPKDFLVFLCKE